MILWRRVARDALCQHSCTYLRQARFFTLPHPKTATFGRLVDGPDPSLGRHSGTCYGNTYANAASNFLDMQSPYLGKSKKAMLLHPRQRRRKAPGRSPTTLYVSMTQTTKELATLYPRPIDFDTSIH
jgi:hypothetical protein